MATTISDQCERYGSSFTIANDPTIRYAGSVMS